MTAPDPAAVRVVVRARWEAPRAGGLSLAGEFADAFGTITAVVEDVWDVADLRPSEEDRLDALASEATVRVRRAAEAALLEAVMEALAAFAAEHPDAPQARG